MAKLKQSTATYISFGPFLDVTDGITPETGLAGTMTVYLSKAGGAYAARNSATAIAHDRKGHYRVHLDATDTNTLGVLTVNVANEATHLDVTKEYMVMPANAYDSMYGSDKLTVDVVEVGSTDSATGLADFKADVSAVTLAAATHTGAVIPTVTDLTNPVTVGAMNAAGAADFMTVDSGETTAVAGSVAKIAQGSAGGSVTVGGFDSAALLELLQTDTGETGASAGSVVKIAQGAGGLDSAAVTAACETAIDNKGLLTYGVGSEEVDLTIQVGSDLIDGCEVWVTATNQVDAAKVASGITDGTGTVTVWLDPGTYYVWKQKSGINFTNPETLVVTS